MYQNVKIENYKSIEKLELELGRVTVLIGANGSGKSNILEALALASAGSQRKLDNEYLVSRGLRVTETRFMRSAFGNESSSGRDILVHLSEGGKEGFGITISADDSASYPKWSGRESYLIDTNSAARDLADFIKTNAGLIDLGSTVLVNEFLRHKSGSLADFLIYAPEYTVLRTFESEGQILPLGIRGEGLFRYLKALGAPAHRDKLQKIQDRLQLIDWFAGFDVPGDLAPGERTLRIQDRFLSDGLHFDQRSANEGFLYLLFYFTLLISPRRPRSSRSTTWTPP